MQSAERAARNESVFRELNEQLDAAASGLPAGPRGFVCECSNIACTAVIAVSAEDYEEVRSHSDRFIVAADESHVEPAIEKIVVRRPGFWVVEKTGAAGDFAEALDRDS